MPFKKPAVTPEMDEQQDAFDQLDDILGEGTPSSAVGWAIKQQSVLGSKEEIRATKRLLWGSFLGRSAHNWALLTICAKQVRMAHHKMLTASLSLQM